MQGDTNILRELYMLTGRVHADKNYLYYLLVKDGTLFKEVKPAASIPMSESAVESLDSWFDSL